MACGDVTGIRVPHLCFHCVQHSGADDAGMYNSVKVLLVVCSVQCKYYESHAMSSHCDIWIELLLQLSWCNVLM